jgi:iron uptake system component EfeO
MFRPVGLHRRETFTMTRTSFPLTRALALTAGVALSLSGAGCSSATTTSDEVTVARAMQQSLAVDLTALHAAAVDLQAAAPTPAGRGWNATTDADAIAAMKTAWIKARVAYEHIEGAVAPIFPDADVAIDERYDGFLDALNAEGRTDTDLFDGMGVTGMHAIERILYVDVTPARVVTSEMALQGYVPAAFPDSEAQAAEFKSGLATRLVTDTQALLDDWSQAVNLDAGGAFRGLVDLMNEQQEKVNNASIGIEESRYSQRTMADLRANLEGTTAIYGLFRDWLKAKPARGALPSGAAVDASIMAGFGALDATYQGTVGDAIPVPPATWTPDNPSAADLQTPFGMLYQAIHREVDPAQSSSVVENMDQGAMLLGIPESSP